MSGGVDSSVAALLLQKQGYEVVGVFMRCFNIDGCQDRDAEDARRVAGHLGIPFYVWDFEEEYKERVVGYMVEGYRKGETPNPDVMCNREIKFGLFLERALRMGADYVATGHYVRLKKFQITNNKSHINHKNQNSEKKESEFGSFGFGSNYSDRYALFQAKDKNKDQSYFLWTLTQEQLRHCLFPIGDYLKSEVRVIAKKAGLSTAEKKDSQGICFLGQVSLPDFLKTYISEKRGAVLNVAGEKVGEHDGAHFYTIGQRHIGLGDRRQVAGGKKKAVHEDQKRAYVAEKDTKHNTLIVAEGEDNEALYRKEVLLRDVNFIEPSHSHVLKNMRMRVLTRVRYRQPLAPANLSVSSHQLSVVSYKLTFASPQKFVASGQSAVFYSEKEEMIGGGIIS